MEPDPICPNPRKGNEHCETCWYCLRRKWGPLWWLRGAKDVVVLKPGMTVTFPYAEKLPGTVTITGMGVGRARPVAKTKGKK